MTEKSKIGYKLVFQRKDGKLVSWTSDDLHASDCVRYIPRKWTEPKKACGPLALYWPRK